MSEESYFRCLLPDGRNVDLMTTQGADAFIGKGKATPYLASNVDEANKIRKRLAQSNISSQERRALQESLVRIYLLLGYVADNASEAVFAGVGDKQLDSFISHACSIFSDRSTAKTWTKTGVLHKHDQELLESLIPSMKQLAFVERVLESNLLETLARLCAAREKTEMPCPDVTESILSIVNNFRVTLYLKDWEKEKIFKLVESTGMLAQVLRCITQPSTDPGALDGHLKMMDELMECQALVRKKLKPGQSTGDVLEEVLSGKSGFKGRRDPSVVMRLRNLQKMASVFNEKVVSNPGGKIGRVCRYCNKADLSEEFQESLLVCSRCKDTYYCSKACQVSDWKVHKKVCTPPNRALEKATKGGQDSIMSFIMANYYDIMKEIVSVTNKENVGKQELVLELDFFANEGSAPALRDPPNFKIGVAKRYIEGRRPDEPDWFHKGSEIYDSNVKMFVTGAMDHYRRMTSNHLLTFVRYASGSTGVYRVMLLTEENGTPLFSDEAYEAFSRALLGDDSQLEEVYGDKHESIIWRRDLDRRNRIQRVMSEQPDGGASFLAGIASMRSSLNEFMSSDRYRDLVEEVNGEECDGDNVDNDYDAVD